MNRGVFLLISIFMAMAFSGQAAAGGLLSTGGDSCGEAEVLPDKDARDAEDEIFRQMNRVRIDKGMKEFTRMAVMDETARRHSGAMSCKGSVFHRDLKEVLDVFQSRGVAFPPCTVAENVGSLPTGNVVRIGKVDSPTDAGRAFVRLWLESPGHRRHIMNEAFGAVGVGVVRDPKGVYYATTLFLGR